MERILGRRRGILLVLAMVAGISAMHLAIGGFQPGSHVVYSKLLYIPVTLAALAHGLRGGLLSGLFVMVCYGPSFVVNPHGSDALLLDFALELPILLGTGVLVGAMVDRERGQHRRAQEAERHRALGQAASILAHEMKTPLVTIGGFARSLLRALKEPMVRRKLGIITVEVDRLERLVRDALNFARQDVLSVSQCTAGHLLDRAREVIEPLAEEQGVDLVVQCGERAAALWCDPERLQQVFINLLDNAIRHTPGGGTVHLCMYRLLDGAIRFEVRDSGEGIAEDELETLFDPFSSGRKDGTGLGLAVARRIVEKHGGWIQAQNRAGGGAALMFELPAKWHGPATQTGSATIAGLRM